MRNELSRLKAAGRREETAKRERLLLHGGQKQNEEQ